jgi:NhaP-type Na+/H+ or K+/H+ antiporter
LASPGRKKAEAYMMYGLAETFHASGIIATLFGSMVMGRSVGHF